MIVYYSINAHMHTTSQNFLNNLTVNECASICYFYHLVGLMLTSSTLVFGIMAYKEKMAENLHGPVRLAWSFQAAIVACACSFLAGIMYLCEGCNILESQARRQYTKLPGSA